MYHPTDRIAHTTAFVTPVVEYCLEREIAQWIHPMKDRSDDPSHHERTLLPRSYISLLLPYCWFFSICGVLVRTYDGDSRLCILNVSVCFVYIFILFLIYPQFSRSHSVLSSNNVRLQNQQLSFEDHIITTQQFQNMHIHL